MRTLWSIALAATFVAAGSWGTARAANWSLTLNAPNQVAAPGGTAVYSGTITNSTGAPIVLDAGLNFVTSPDPAIESFTIDFAAGLLALDLVIPTTGYTGPILQVSWHNDAVAGSYGVGELQLLAGVPADVPVLTAAFTLATPGGFGPFCDNGTGFGAGGNSIASNDSTGYPEIAYNNPVAGTLAYAVFNGTQWSSTPIATGIGGEAAPSLAMDGDVRPHVAFYDAVAQDLVHAWNLGAGWQTEIIESAGNVGADPSLVVDPYGELHVSYYDVTNGDLRYAKRAGGVWNAVAVDAVGDVGRYSAITTDEFGKPYISYYDSTNQDLKLARLSGGVWVNEVVDGTGSRGTSTSVRVRGGVVSISYREATPGSTALRFATGTPGSWTREVVDAVGDPGHGSSLELNDFGQPRIAYFAQTGTEVRFASKSGPTWTIEPVSTGAEALLSLGSSVGDEPFMSYVQGGQLYFASVTVCAPVTVGDLPAPPALVLQQSRPNPFSGSATFAFATARTGEVRIRVYDVAGRVVAEPFSGTLGAGAHTVTWKGTGRTGRRLAPGRYVYEVRSGGEARTGQMVMLR